MKFKHCHPKDRNSNKKQLLPPDEYHNKPAPKGLNVLTATLFLVGDVAGSGVLTFPWALSRTGWIGILLMVSFAAVATYAAALIGRCWLIISERFVEYRDQPVRHPYPLIGQEAFGKHCSSILGFVKVLAFAAILMVIDRLMSRKTSIQWTKWKHNRLISLCVNFTSCGSCVAFLLLVSQNLMALLPSANIDYGCWLVIVAGVLCPLCWFGTPKDFWFIALFATLTTSTAAILILVQIARESPDVPPAFHAPLEPKTFLMSFGILCIGFGGHQVFPTIQVDMKQPERFGWAAAIAFTTILGIYIPVAITTYLVYGSSVEYNVLLSLSSGPMYYTTMILMCAHLVAGFVIILNPVSQEIEDFLKVPNDFCYQRVLIRTFLVGILLFVALSVPQFGAILALIGGSTMTFLIFIIPPVCYLKLSSMKGEWKTEEVPLHEKVLCIELIFIGALAGLAATYTALDALTYSHFSKPLYLSWC